MFWGGRFLDVFKKLEKRDFYLCQFAANVQDWLFIRHSMKYRTEII